jgi:hypothetical protein
VDLSGWVIAPAGSLVGLGGAQTTFAWQRLGEIARPDVPGAFAFTASSISTEAPTELNLKLPDGRQGSVMLTTLKAGATASFEGSAPTLLGLDSLNSNAKPRRGDRWLSKLCTLYEWIGYLFCLATIGGVLTIALQKKHSAVALITLLAISAIAARVALFGILDASSWSGIQARYILPIVPFFACMGVLGIALVGGAVKKG